MGFAVDKVALGQASFGVQWYPLTLSRHQCPILLFIFQDFLIEEQTSEESLPTYQEIFFWKFDVILTVHRR